MPQEGHSPVLILFTNLPYPIYLILFTNPRIYKFLFNFLHQSKTAQEGHSPFLIFHSPVQEPVMVSFNFVSRHQFSYRSQVTGYCFTNTESILNIHKS